jgi:hypothetical protein
MASIGAYLDVLSRGVGRARGSITAENNELRSGGLMPTGPRGLHAPDLDAQAVISLLISATLNPPAGAVVETVLRVRSLPRNDEVSEFKIFGDLTVAYEVTLGEALEALLADAVAGRLQKWMEKPGAIVIEFVDSADYVKIEVRRAVGRAQSLVFMKPGAGMRAQCLWRTIHLDSRIFELLAPLMTT